MAKVAIGDELQETDVLKPSGVAARDRGKSARIK